MIQPPIHLKDQIKIGKVNINHLTQSISEIPHNLKLSNIKRKQIKGKLGAISHIYMPKTSISSRIQKFRRRPLKICPLDGQIQGEVVVGTTLGKSMKGRFVHSLDMEY